MKQERPYQNIKDTSSGSVKETSTVLSFDTALEIFINAQRAANKSKATMQDYRCVLMIFLRYMSETHHYSTMNEVEEDDIVEWLAHLRSVTNKWGRAYSSRSIETYHRDVRVFFSWLAKHGHLPDSPMSGIEKMKTERTLIRVFTEDELTRLDAACDRTQKQSLTVDERKALASRDRAFLWLLLSTGIRLSEACGLLFSDIDWGTEMIYVRGKGAKERKVPFGKVARQYLDTYIRYWRAGATKSDDHVFLNINGNPLRPSSGGQIFCRLKEVARITDKRVSAHTCRHWFAVNSIKQGMPTIVLKGLLGHENWEMIETYVRLAEQDNRDLYTKFSPVDNLSIHKSSSGKREQMREWRTSRKKGSSS